MSRSCSRRRMLALSISAMALALGLAGCSSDDAGPGGAVIDGGTLRVGILGSPADLVDPSTATTLQPYAIALNVFDSVALIKDGEISYQLAESITPNDTASAWTIVIRHGVTFHDGSELSADDVLYSLRYLAQGQNFMSSYRDVNWEASTADGDRTVVIALNSPNAAFVEEALAMMSIVFPEGTTHEGFQDAIGSGPFKLERFSADTGSVLVKNDDYWDGAPKLDRIEIVPITDASARLSALTGGQLDYASSITATGAETIRGSDSFVVIDRGAADSASFSFTMNTSIAPFDDPEVRVAFKEVVDRQQLVDVVFNGRGEIGNDVPGKNLTGYFDELVQRERDLDAATAVLADKGVTEVGILAAETAPGMLDSVDLLRQQLAEVGVTLRVDVTDAATVYSDLDAIYNAQMFANYLTNRPIASGLRMYTALDSPFNFTRWDDPRYQALLAKFTTVADPAARQDALDELQRMQWENGSEILWGYQSVLNASISTLTGIEVSQGVPLFASAEYAN